METCCETVSLSKLWILVNVVHWTTTMTIQSIAPYVKEIWRTCWVVFSLEALNLSVITVNNNNNNDDSTISPHRADREDLLGCPSSEAPPMASGGWRLQSPRFLKSIKVVTNKPFTVGGDDDDNIDFEEKLSPPRCYIMMKMVTMMLVIMTMTW